MFCTKCGKEFREGAAFCTNCGAPRPKLEAPAPQPVQPEAPAPAPEAAVPPAAAPVPAEPLTAEAPAPAPAEEAPAFEAPVSEPAEPAAEAPAPQQAEPVTEIPFEIEPEAAAQEAPPAPILQPTAPAVQQTAVQTPPQTPVDLEPPAPKKKKGKGGLIALIVILVLLIAAGAFVALCQLGIVPIELPFEIPFLSGESGNGDSGDLYQDTVNLSKLIAKPEDFDGQRIGVNAEVDEIDGAQMTVSLSAGKGELAAALAFSEDDITVFSVGDNIYVDGTFHFEESALFDPAIVTLTSGRDEGKSVRTAAQPAGGTDGESGSNEDGETAGDAPEEWSVTDYTPYQGYFTAVSSQSEFEANGGLVVVLSSERSSLLYEIRSQSAGNAEAVITGAAPMDGSPEVSFYGDDSCGNTVSGTLTLLEDGNIAVESNVVDAGSAGWALEAPYTKLTPCTFSDYFTTPQAPYNEQELRVTTNGPYATVTLYNWKNGGWEEKMSFQATIGSNGATYSKQEGDKSTPAGTYDILFAFSTLDIFSGIPYYRIQDGDVWVTDTNSAYYNTLQSNYSASKDWSQAEDLYSKFNNGRSTACIYFGFNGDGLSAYSAVSGGGSDLFLDGIGSSGNLTTGYGDIKTDGQNVLDLLRELNGNKHPVIIIE